MKKFKVVVYILILLAIASYFICLSVIPTQTIQVTDKFIGWLNTPVGIAGISTTIGGIFIFIVTKFVFANSKFGRKELDNIKKDNAETKEQFDTLKNAFYDNLRITNDWCEETKNECDNQVTIMLNEFEDLQNNMLTALKTIPNKKVQEIVSEYKSQYDVRKEEIIEKTVNTNDYVDKKLNELFNEFKNKMENMLNEETINIETEKE